MKVNRQLTFLFVAFALLCVFLYAISNILLPFVLGILVAYMMDPVVDQLEARRIHRGVASALVLVIFFSFIIALGFITLPLIFEQIEGFVAKLPDYYREFNSEILPMLRHKLEKISPVLSAQLNSQAKDIPLTLTSVVGVSLNRILTSSLWLFNIISLILITPIVSFYLLRDWDISMAKIYSLLPQNYAPIIKKQARKVDDTISAFLRGELTVCIIMGFLYGISLSLTGLKFGFLIGMITGALTFIPFIGPLVGALIGVTIAFLQFGDDYVSTGIVAGVFLIVQNIESNLITPKIVGNKIGVHPAWLLFSMLAGASLLGVLGVIIAVPVTAVIAVLLRFAIEQYEHSSYYLRNRNTEHLSEPLNYRGEPGSLLRVDNLSTILKNRKRRSIRVRKKHIAQKRRRKQPVAK